MSESISNIEENLQTATQKYLGVSENSEIRRVLDFFKSSPKLIVVEMSKMGNPYHIILTLAETYDDAINADLSRKKERTFVRDRLISGMLFWTGMRDREITLIKKKDFDLISKTFTVPTLKQRKKSHGVVHRPIPLDHVPTSELRFWNHYFEQNGIGSEDLVVGISPRSVERATHRLLGMNPHALRHGLGLFLYELTKDIRLVAQVLRHSNIANTMIYTKLSMDDVRKKLKYF